MRISYYVGSAAFALLATGGSAQASSEQAWQAFDARVTRACIAASGIRDPSPSSIIGFDDRAGKVAMLVSDRARGSAASKLCLYDKRSRKAFIQEAEGWSAPPAPR